MEVTNAATKGRLPGWTIVFMIWVAAAATKGVSATAGHVAANRWPLSIVDLVITLGLAVGFVLLYIRHPSARAYWLVALSVLALPVTALLVVPGGIERGIVLVILIGLGAWIAYFARSRRLRMLLRPDRSAELAPPVA
jgi:hypothetical protein